MKLKIDDELREVDVWSFIKCHIIANIVILGLVYGFLMATAIVFGFLP